MEKGPSSVMDDQHFKCPICFDTFAATEVTRVDGCGHVTCGDCMKEYCEYHVSIHRVPVPCPVTIDQKEAEDTTDSPPRRRIKIRRTRSSSSNNSAASNKTSCPQFLSNKLVEQVLHQPKPPDVEEGGERKEDQAAPSLNKYRRLHILASDLALVPCMRCDEVVSPPQDMNSNVRSCPRCQHVFCAIHGDAHLGRNCDDSGGVPEKSSAPTDSVVLNSSPDAPSPPSPTRSADQTESTIAWGDDSSTKPCSHCKAPIHKSGGCDHIVCVACNNDMCFQCGTHQYLSGKMTRFCSKCHQGYLDHRYLGRLRCLYLLCLPFLLPVFAAFFALSLCGVLITGCCFGCFTCGADLNSARKFDPRRGIITVGGILFLPIVYMLYDTGFRWPWLQEMIDIIESKEGASDSTNDLGDSPTFLSVEEG